MGYLGATHLSLRPQGTKVALQVSVGHQLHHHQCWLPLGHHPQEADLRSKHKGAVIKRVCGRLQHPKFSLSGRTQHPAPGWYVVDPEPSDSNAKVNAPV